MNVEAGGSRKGFFGTRFMALTAITWTLLVWLNWLGSNPVSPARIGRALAAYGSIRAGEALGALGGHALLVSLAFLLAAAAVGAGAPVLSWLQANTRRRAGMMRAALGGGAVSFTVLGAGFCGLLYPSLGWICAVVAGAYSLRFFRLVPLGWTLRGYAAPFAVICVIALWVALLGNLSPEISYDALVHHLAHPAKYAAYHKVFALPYHFLSNYPALLEMQYLLAILLGKSMQAAKLVHFMWGVLTLAFLVSWARESLEDHWVVAGAAAFLLLPYVQIVLMWSYVDLGAAALLTAALISVMRPRINPVLVGVFCGLCAGTKVTGAFAPVLAFSVMVFRGAGRRTIAVFAAVFVVVALPWGARNFINTGNPTAPFLSRMIPTLCWNAGNQSRYEEELGSYSNKGEENSVVSLMAIPWRASVRNVGVLDTMAGMGGWFIWALPLLFLSGASAGGVFALVTAGYFCLWLFVPHQVRYLLPAWPVAVIGALHAVRGLAARGGTALLPVWAAGGVLLLNLGAAVERQHFVINPLPVVSGAETPEAYRGRGVPGRPYSLRAMAWLGKNIGDERVLIISAYSLGTLWGPKSVFQSVFDTPLIEAYSRESGDILEIAKRFKQAGIRYVMYSQSAGFILQAVYGAYNFDRGSARRWKEYWALCPDLVHNQNDQYLFYRLSSCLAGRGRRRISALPGVDEQLLGKIDKQIMAAEMRGMDPEELRRFAAEYRSKARGADSPCALERLGVVLLRAGDVPGAREALMEAGRLGRSTAVFHDALGAVESHDRNLAAAIAHFRKALDLDPEQDHARRSLAAILSEVGRSGEAMQILKEGAQTGFRAGETGSLQGF